MQYSAHCNVSSEIQTACTVGYEGSDGLGLFDGSALELGMFALHGSCLVATS